MPESGALAAHEAGLLEGDEQDADQAGLLGALQENCDPAPQARRQLFYDEYLAVYFPKAYVIVEQYFTTMCSDGVDEALAELLTIWSEWRWFYFKNSPDEFEGGKYWENILEQQTIIHTFLQRAKVNLNDNTVFIPRSYKFASPRDPDSIGLLAYWKRKGKTAHYDFYACHFDDLLKMFNEGIRFKILPQARQYQRKIELIFLKLRGSGYEARYREVVNRSKELLTLLQKRLDEEKQRRYVFAKRSSL